MGMAVYDAVSFSELLKHPLLNIMTGAVCTMTGAEEVTIDHKALFIRQYLSCDRIAHVAAHAMNLFVLEYPQDGYICQVTGVYDSRTVFKSFAGHFLKAFGR